jgi:hypothetical protein
MTVLQKRRRVPAPQDDSSAITDRPPLDLGQRRAVAWPRIEPSVTHRAETAALAAVVHTVDSIQFIAVERDDEALLRQFASYVAANANDQLWMADAVNVHALLAARDFEAAVRAYFTAADTPWDRDWLVIESIHLPTSL